MISRISFYFRHAFRNITRGGRWTVLAIFCIGAGVATIVALRSLGLGIADSLVSNVRIENKGDILLSKSGFSGAISAGLSFQNDLPVFSDAEIQQVKDYTEARGGQIAAFFTGRNMQVAATDFNSFGRPQFVSSYFIDPQTYPPTHEIRAIEPADVPLNELFTGGNEVVVSENFAQAQDLTVGDFVRVSGTEEPYVVRGIVPAQHEAGLQNLIAAFFGFVYFDIGNARQVIDSEITPNKIAIAFPDPLDEETMQRAIREILPLASTTYPAPWASSYLDILERNEVIGQILGDFIVVLGVGALLIGGVGIMNTMLVMVRRRTNEIAALKTFGLKGRQVATLFVIEAAILGILGSLIGMIVGVLASTIVNQFGETLIQEQLAFRIYPEAILYGFAIGIVITVIFGVAPILSAVRIRPGIILRPNETHIPKVGVLQWLLLMILLTVVIGLIVGNIISPSFNVVDERASFGIPSPYVIGIIGVTLTFLFLAVLVGILWVIVWIIGKFPSFGSIDLRLALKNLSTHRLRTATTLLALSAGMFALSSIAYIGEGTRELLNQQLSSMLGGNVLVFPVLPGAIADLAVNVAVSGIDDIESRTTFENYIVRLLSVDGQPVSDELVEGPFGSEMNARTLWDNPSVIDTDNMEFLAGGAISEGRALTLEDRGSRVLVGPAQFAEPLGISIGSILTYQVGNQQLDFEVVGLAESQGVTPSFVTMPPESLGDHTPTFTFFTFQIDSEDSLNEALVNLSNVPLVFSLDVGFIDGLVSRLINQFAAIPTVVGIFSLLAAAVIMANTIALSTLERRRQIGILKAVGLKSKRVLFIMLIETTIVGLLSAVLGLGLSSIIISLITSIGGTPIPIPSDARITTILLVAVAVAIAWFATLLSANVAVRERVMNVLRYE